MDQVSILLWISLFAAVPVAAAGLFLRRNAAAQGMPFRRAMIGWALIAAALLMAVAAGFFFWRMNTAGGECARPMRSMSGSNVDYGNKIYCPEGLE